MNERLAKVFERAFAFSPAKFTAQLTPNDVPKWDSLGHMKLVAELEAEFSVRFEIDEVMEMASVAKIIKILKTKTGCTA